MIPKNIHQIWFQGENNIPDKYKENIITIKKYHTNWNYTLWTNDTIKNILSGDLLNLYNNYVHMHQKIDFAKYVILFKFGGVYLDMDVKSLKPLDTLIDENKNKDIIVSKTNTNFFESIVACSKFECINNGVIIASPNNKILKHIINYCLSVGNCNSLLNKELCINITTGPLMFTKIINKYRNDSTLILNNDYFEPCSYTKCTITDNTFTKHQHELSWMSSNVKLFLNFYVNNKILFFIMLSIIIYIIIKKID